MKTYGPEVLSSLKRQPYYWRYLLTYAALLMGSTLAKIKVRGKLNLPKKGPYVVASNHFSDYDPLFFSYGIQKPINFIAASDQELEWQFIWAPIIYGWIPVNRKKISPSTIKQSIEVLKRGEILGIFPDGGVSYDLLSKPKNGAVFLSTIGKAPIVPISIYGAENAWNDVFRGVRPRVFINIGKPFGPHNIKGNKKEKTQKMEEVGYEMMCRIAALLPKNRRGPYVGSQLINKIQIQNQIVPQNPPLNKQQKN